MKRGADLAIQQVIYLQSPPDLHEISKLEHR
jgi:hypothetical protein